MTEAEQATSGATGEYRVLARKYRPGTFDELIGQEAMVRTLANAIESGRLAHAFVLTGVRGVGKTTTARLIARALNCTGADGTGGITTSPCGVCDNCVAIAESRHVDVLEMDAASRTGVDDIREIIESVRYAPVAARHKVYIIDEVHMLSKNAFNALLKTLEEPPPHVKFLFATTEIRKLPVTVLSRCQRFDLRRVDSEILAEHLRAITEKEGVSIEPEALGMIVRAAEGSVRDALSLLDQAIAHGGSGTIAAEEVRAMLGIADRARMLDLFEAVMAGKTAEALGLLKEQHELGADPAVVLKDLLGVCHWLTRLRVMPDAGSDALISEAERVKGGALAEALAMPHLTRAWQMLLKGVQEVQRAPAPQAAAEMALIRLCYAAELPTPAELIERNGPTRVEQSKPQEDPAPAPDRPTAPKSSPQAAVARDTEPPTVKTPVGVEASTGRGAMLALKDEALSDETAPEPIPTSFGAMVEMFERRREGIIGTHLRDDVGLVSYKPGALEIRVQGRTPVDMPSRMRRCLEEWTGRSWQISITTEGGDPTLREQAEARDAAAREKAMEDPLVRAAMETFPGARIVGVTPVAPTAPGKGNKLS